MERILRISGRKPLSTEFDIWRKRPGVAWTVNPHFLAARLHAECVEQTVIVVRVSVSLVDGDIELVGAFDEIEALDTEGHFSFATGFLRHEALEVRIGAVAVDPVGTVDANAEDEVGRRLVRAHTQVDRHRIAGLENVRHLALRGFERHAGYFELARTPAALVAARHVVESGRYGGWTLDAGLRVCFVNSAFLRAFFGARELFLFASAHVRQIGANNPFRVSRPAYLAAVKPQRFIAEPLDEVERMGDEQDRLAPSLEFAELIEALVGKAFVSNGEYFVHEQDIRIDVNRHGKAKAHVHA